MANTFTLISTTTVATGSPAAFVFSSIPGTYTDLVVKLSLRTDAGSSFPNPQLQFNGDTASNYKWRGLYGDGAGGVGSNSSTSATNILLGAATGTTETSNTFANTEIYIPNYAGSTQKSVSTDGVPENNGTYNYLYLTAGLWTGTAAITSMRIFFTSNIVTGSTASLYGVKSGSGGATVS